MLSRTTVKTRLGLALTLKLPLRVINRKCWVRFGMEYKQRDEKRDGGCRNQKSRLGRMNNEGRYIQDA